MNDSRLTNRLERAHPALLNGYTVALAFTTYFCMYAFRKPFAAAAYEGLSFAGTRIDLKTALVISQIIGYALSKFVGIRACSETGRDRRAPLLVSLIVAAELALVLFAVLPPSWKVVAIFLNGLPLGMVWGLVVRYLEGRRTSDFLLAGLSCSFIVSSGVVKDVGLALMQHRGLFGIDALTFGAAVPESWMPAVVGLLFLPIFLLAVWLLNQTPEPTALDVEARSERAPMDRASRYEFLRRFAPGMAMLIVAYMALTAFRDFRDNYEVDVMKELGYGDPAHNNLISKMELGVAFGVMAAMGALCVIRDNRRALLTMFGLMIAGVVLLGGGTALYRSGAVSGMSWMTMIGLGVYLVYVPYNSLLFDRLIASTRVTATAVFAIYVADSLGYTCSIGVQLYKDLGNAPASRLEFLVLFSYVMSGLGVAMLAGSCWYFWGCARSASSEIPLHGGPLHEDPPTSNARAGADAAAP